MGKSGGKNPIKKQFTDVDYLRVGGEPVLVKRQANGLLIKRIEPSTGREFGGGFYATEQLRRMIDVRRKAGDTQIELDKLKFDCRFLCAQLNKIPAR